MLYGKRFFRDEFGVEVGNLWLPDVFGYSAALPQIMALSGVKYFLTQKLSWSRTNKFPYHSFHWKGIDGTEVLVHMPPEDTYNSPAAPRSAWTTETAYSQRDVSDRALVVFGIGDGGGGPGEEHLERLARMKDLSGIAPVRQERAMDFFEDWKKDAARFPSWSGELYLEKHEGTFTTHGTNKRYNRRMEFALREAEWSSVLAGLLCGRPYPSAKLAEIWRDVLLYQFHDVLPGSSIKRVYDETSARYREMLEETQGLVRLNYAAVASRLDCRSRKSPAVLFNSLSWERRGWLKRRDRWVRYAVPALGYTVVDAGDECLPGERPFASEKMLENDKLKVRFNRDGSISSVFDKGLCRELIAEGKSANRLSVYSDTGDAWDFPVDYRSRPIRYPKLESVKAGVDGPCVFVEQLYRIGRSILTQRISLLAGSRRLEFATTATWRETNSMLRTSFPIDIAVDKARCDIAFGSLERPTHSNTAWDLAKDEVPCHKWADLSQRDWGVALLNDSKYGYRVKDCVLDLNLLRSVSYPRPPIRDRKTRPGEPDFRYTDQCDHAFTYALYPHAGDHVQGNVVREAYELNVPVGIAPARPTRAGLDPHGRLFSIDSPNVVVDTVKKAEDDDSVIVRCFECAGGDALATFAFPRPVADVHLTDLLEEGDTAVPVKADGVTVHFHPFEIKTIRIKFRR
jgi:alpha-mannosidase